jgi:hypothetical protein
MSFSYSFTDRDSVRTYSLALAAVLIGRGSLRLLQTRIGLFCNTYLVPSFSCKKEIFRFSIDGSRRL